MNQSITMHNTFVIERNYPCAPDRVFQAFADPQLKRRWFAEGSPGHDVETFDFDFCVGGIERIRYRFNEKSPFPGVPLIADGFHLDILAGQRIVTASSMTIGDKRISASLVTAEIQATDSGTSLLLTHQGAFFEGADGPVMREAGWNELLARLENWLGS